jgi:NAD(P)H-dependent FMN reductase
MYKLKVISSTVRPGRKGPLVAHWITDLAKLKGTFDVEFLDLGEINLPMMNEAHHPSKKKIMNMNIPNNGVPRLRRPMPLFL